MVRFIKSTYIATFTITGITCIVIKFIVSFKKGQDDKRKFIHVLKGNFRCQVVYSLHGDLARNYIALRCHGMAPFVLKMADLSILMEPTLTGKGVSYDILQRFWVMLVVS